MSNQEVSLQLVRVKCGDETGGKYVERVGNDEIWLSGVAVDAAGETHKLEPFEVYPHFDDGDVKKFSPPKTIFRLRIPGGGNFPKTCLATLLLAEKDSGDLTALAQDAFDKATRDMEEMKDGMGMGEGEEPPPDFWDKLVEKAREWTYGYIKDRITIGLNDDVFSPQIVTLSVTSDDFRWGDGTKLSPEITVEFRGHDGVYYLVYYWEIRTLEVTRPSRGGGVVITPPVGGGVLHP
jgi:hypothetical protein